VLALGDLQYEAGSLSQFNTYYQPRWGALKPVTYPVPGNHEYATSGAAGYFSYFGARAGTPGQGWYSFDYGGWHIVALNSNCSAVGGCGPTSPQGQWLTADLAANPECTVAFAHHPAVSEGNYSGTSGGQALWQIVYDGGGDLMLFGHDHNYQRFPTMNRSRVPAAGGMREFVVGTGGRGHYTLDPPSIREAGNDTRFGVLRLTLNPTGYDFAFVDINGSVLDSGNGSCR
jgi:hypothetical protein